MLIRRVLFTETGTYNDMWASSYGTHVKSDTLARLQHATQLGENLTVPAMAVVGSEILRPSATVESSVGIVNGWGETKFRFMMEIEHMTSNGNVLVDILSGYTDYTGISQQTNNMDPRMMLFINSVTSVTLMKRIGANGQPTQHLHIRESNQVMPGYFSGNGAQNQFYLAPQDVFDGIGLMTAMGGLADARGLRTVDSRNVAMDAPRLSSRGNNHTGSYLSRVMSGYRTALDSANTHDSNMSTVLKAAKSTVVDRNPYEVASLGALLNATDMQHRSGVTWGELLRFRPDLESVTHVSFNRGAVIRDPNRDPIATRGDSEHWDVANNETVAARMVAHTVPTLMTDAKFTKVSFTMTNDTINPANGTPYSVIVHDVAGFSSILSFDENYMRNSLRTFSNRIATELMPGITFGNQMLANIDVTCDTLGDTRINVSLNGGPHVPYTNPQWCDALTAPTVTLDSNKRNVMARDIQSLMENINTVDYR